MTKGASENRHRRPLVEEKGHPLLAQRIETEAAVKRLAAGIVVVDEHVDASDLGGLEHLGQRLEQLDAKAGFRSGSNVKHIERCDDLPERKRNCVPDGSAAG